MEVCIDAKDRVTLYIHNLPKGVEVVDCTRKEGSIADKRYKIGKLEIIIFAEANDAA